MIWNEEIEAEKIYGVGDAGDWKKDKKKHFNKFPNSTNMN